MSAETQIQSETFPTKIAETTFRARVVREYSAVPTVEDLGVRDNRATLYATAPGVYSVEWEAGDEFAAIGVWTEGKKVTDYDGVFELPREIVSFLKAQGFDTSEVEA